MANILVYVDTLDGHIKKASLEALSFAQDLATAHAGQCAALVLGSQAIDYNTLAQYGAQKIYVDNSTDFDALDSMVFTAALTDAMQQTNTDVLILNHDSTGKSLLGGIAVKCNIAAAASIQNLQLKDGTWIATRSVYSGKALAEEALSGSKIVVSMMNNSFKALSNPADGTMEALNLAKVAARCKVIERKTITGTVPLPEAELVVSAGRGMKGPENWGIIEDLAAALEASTACSRPVADSGWRPHYEHVGQTGVAIRPNLYIAIGISGAIQHLAGVNNSKVIVVINKDPEAPFFKAADYGVVGDLFEVVPRLTEAVKKYKAAQ